MSSASDTSTLLADLVHAALVLRDRDLQGVLGGTSPQQPLTVASAEPESVAAELASSRVLGPGGAASSAPFLPCLYSLDISGSSGVSPACLARLLTGALPKLRVLRCQRCRSLAEGASIADDEHEAELRSHTATSSRARAQVAGHQHAPSSAKGKHGKGAHSKRPAGAGDCIEALDPCKLSLGTLLLHASTPPAAHTVPDADLPPQQPPQGGAQGRRQLASLHELSVGWGWDGRALLCMARASPWLVSLEVRDLHIAGSLADVSFPTGYSLFLMHLAPRLLALLLACCSPWFVSCSVSHTTHRLSALLLCLALPGWLVCSWVWVAA